MNHNPFETIQNWLNRNNMTVTEKRQLKQALVSYVTTHPVKSGLLSPYTFRYAMVALASLVIVLGGSVGITSASMSALPNQKLYAMKLFIEDFRSNNQKTPADKIAFESARIKTRFDEATTLAIRHELNTDTSNTIESGIEHSRDAINTVADSVSATNPELALSATTNLQTTFSSNGKVLAVIGKNTGQDLGRIILGTEITTKTLAAEKTKFEQIVAMKPNDDSKAAAVAKLAEIIALLPASDATTSATVTATQTTTTDATTPIITTALAKTAAVSAVLAIKDTTPDAATLVAQAQKQMDAGAYSDALVTLQKAEQILDEQTLTAKLESTYQVKIDPTATATTDATVPASDTSGTPAASPTTPAASTTVTADATISAAATIPAKALTPTDVVIKKPQ